MIQTVTFHHYWYHQMRIKKIQRQGTKKWKGCEAQHNSRWGNHIKPKLHLDVTLMDKFFQILDPKMPLTPPPGCDVNPLLKALENSIDICNSFNTLQTEDVPPPPPILPKEASITTTPSTTTDLATTTSVVPATLPKRPVAVMCTAAREMCPRAQQIKVIQLAQMEQALGLRDASIELSSPTFGHAAHFDPLVALTILELEELECEKYSPIVE